MTSTEAIDALERYVRDGKVTLRAALAYAWQHGCTHGSGATWPDYDVRRVGDRWCVVRVADGSVISTHATAPEAHDAHVVIACTPDVPGPRSSWPPPPSRR